MPTPFLLFQVEKCSITDDIFYGPHDMYTNKYVKEWTEYATIQEQDTATAHVLKMLAFLQKALLQTNTITEDKMFNMVCFYAGPGEHIIVFCYWSS